MFLLCAESNEKRVNVMNSSGLLQKKVARGEQRSGVGGSFSSCYLSPTDRPSGQTKAHKKMPRYGLTRKSGNIVPPVPFCMKPTALSLYLRQKLGGRSLLRAARHPMAPIAPKAAPKPSCELPTALHRAQVTASVSPVAEALEQFMVEKRRVHRKPQLPTHSLASLHRQSVHTSPVKQLIVRPSPTPISPSYKAAKVAHTPALLCWLLQSRGVCSLCRQARAR